MRELHVCMSVWGRPQGRATTLDGICSMHWLWEHHVNYLDRKKWIHFGKNFSCIGKLTRETCLLLKHINTLWWVLNVIKYIFQGSSAPGNMYRSTCKGANLWASDLITVPGFTVDVSSACSKEGLAMQQCEQRPIHWCSGTEMGALDNKFKLVGYPCFWIWSSP